MAKPPNTRLDGLLEAMKIVAEESGKTTLGDYNDRSWASLCQIYLRLSGEAAREAEHSLGEQAS